MAHKYSQIAARLRAGKLANGFIGAPDKEAADAIDELIAENTALKENAGGRPNPTAKD